MLAEAKVHNSLVPRAHIDDLQAIMAAMPQAPGMDTEHFFAGGMYCRRIHIPAGTAIVSKVHKTEHLFIGCLGELKIVGQGETYILRAGDVVPSPVGTKRAVYAMSDVVCLTVHKTDLTSTEHLEAELMEEDELSLYDINNQPKRGVLVVDTKEDKKWLG
jgi:quercetin dioxygenase-like cupin family protein